MIKLLIFGGAGLVGSRFIELNENSFEILAPGFSEIDILNKDQLSRVFEQFRPETVINFAAFTDVEGAEKQKGDKSGSCYQINAIGAKNVADFCKKTKVHLIHISTDYVFDGTKEESPYNEDDKPNPINWYGQTKYFGEKFVLESGGNCVLVRISMPYSAHYKLKKDIARFFLNELKGGNTINAVKDQRITPTLVDDIANALKIIIQKQSTGIYHVSATNDTSPYEFAKMLAKAFLLDESLIIPISLDEYSKEKHAALLRFSRLQSSKFIHEFGKKILHTVEESVETFKQQIDHVQFTTIRFTRT